MSAIHHVELWVPDFAGARPRWGWLLTALGWSEFQHWEHGCSWRASDGGYVVIEESPDLTGARHERTLPGLNHLALTARDPEHVDTVVAGAAEHGWQLMFSERHPHAGGPESYAAYLADEDGYEVEVVAAG